MLEEISITLHNSSIFQRGTLNLKVIKLPSVKSSLGGLPRATYLVLSPASTECIDKCMGFSSVTWTHSVRSSPYIMPSWAMRSPIEQLAIISRTDYSWPGVIIKCSFVEWWTFRWWVDIMSVVTIPMQSRVLLPLKKKKRESIVSIQQGWGFKLRSGQIQEATNERINEWNNKLISFSLSLSFSIYSLPWSL